MVCMHKSSCLLWQTAEAGYRRLTPDQPVGLKHSGYVISLDRVVKVCIYCESAPLSNPQHHIAHVDANLKFAANHFGLDLNML